MTKVMPRDNKSKTAATKNKTLSTKEIKALRKKINAEATLSPKDIESLKRAFKLRASKEVTKNLSVGKTKALWELTKTVGRLIEADTAYIRELLADKSFDAAVSFTATIELCILMQKLRLKLKQDLRAIENPKVYGTQEDTDFLSRTEARL